MSHTIAGNYENCFDPLKYYYDSALADYNIKDKVRHIIFNKATDMKVAFCVGFDALESPSPYVVSMTTDDDTLWRDNKAYEEQVVEIVNSQGVKQETSFFHTLQLVVADGLKDTACVNSAFLKICKLLTSLNSNFEFEELFEANFESLNVPEVVTTEWSSMITMLNVVLKLNQGRLDAFCDAAGKTDLNLTERERQLLTLLSIVLSPFLEATLKTKGKEVCYGLYQ